MIDAVFFKNKRILITGSSGSLARSLRAALMPLQTRIRCLSRQEKPACLGGEIEWIQEKNLAAPEIWEKHLIDIDILFHFAAQTSARIADQNPEEDYQINVLPLLNLVQTAKKHSLKNLTVLFAGTATQYGIPSSLPVNETYPDSPMTTYDKHKCLAEKALLQAAKNRILRAVSLRLCNLYGSENASSAPDRGIINQMLESAMEGRPLTLVKGAEDLIRDYLFIEDAVSAFLEAAQTIEKISGDALVIGSGTGHTLGETFKKIAAKVSAKTKKNILITLIENELSLIDRRNFIADSTRFREKTGWFPRHSLDQGLDSMIEKYSCVS